MKNDFSVVKQENNFHLFESGEIGKGITKLLLSSFAPWLAKQEGKAKCIAAQYDNDAKDIADRRKQWKDGIPVQASEVSTLGDLCRVLVHNESDYKAKCLERALLVAASIIRDIPDEDISDESVNPTFLNHWREEAELIDDDDLRELWANLLVEETCKPNSISPRTLSVVKNLSRQDAQAFDKLCQMLLTSNSFLINERGIPLNGTYGDVLLLQDAGLISQASSGHLVAEETDAFIGISPKAEEYFLKAFAHKIDFSCHTLTTAGFQIVKFVKQENLLKNMKIIAKELSKQNNNITIHLVKTVDGLPKKQAPEIWNTTQAI